MQRLEGQTKAAIEEAGQRDQHLKLAQNARDEAERETGRLLAELEMLEGRQEYKVRNWGAGEDRRKRDSQTLCFFLNDKFFFVNFLLKFML